MRRNASTPFCPPGHRRGFLERAGLTLGGLTLPRILGARSAAARDDAAPPETAVIFVTLGGGPSQLETYDPKPDAPAEIRGPFGVVATSVPGVRFCELLPKQARILDKLAVVRSIQHQQASHIAEHIVETGYDLTNPQKSLTGEMPSVGSIVSAVRGPSPAGIPAYVSIPDRRAYAGPHWLGGEHRLFAVNEDPNDAAFAIRNLTLDSRLSVARLEDRRGLSVQLDRARHWFDRSESGRAVDVFDRQAFELVTGDRARQAFDIAAEPPSVRDAYGRHTLGQRMLLARRLVEIGGVPFVTVRMGDWDDHQELAAKIKPRCTQYDQALTALIEDLHSRGLNRRVLVIAMGEFGRTPKVNANAGRDHWPRVASVLLSGGQYRMGQVIGATDGWASRVAAAPYAPQSVQVMAYRHLGIDPARTFDDYSGRPRYALEQREPIRELL